MLKKQSVLTYTALIYLILKIFDIIPVNQLQYILESDQLLNFSIQYN